MTAIWLVLVGTQCSRRLEQHPPQRRTRVQAGHSSSAGSDGRSSDTTDSDGTQPAGTANPTETKQTWSQTRQLDIICREQKYNQVRLSPSRCKGLDFNNTKMK